MASQFLNYEQLLQCHGEEIEMLYRGHTYIDATIFVEDNKIYLLQNVVQSGTPNSESWKDYGYENSFRLYDSDKEMNTFSQFGNVKFKKDYPKEVVQNMEQKQETSSIEYTSVNNKDLLSNITTSELQTLLLAVEIQLPVKTTDRIIDCIELLQEKGDSITISDINKLKSEWNINQI